MPTYKAPVDDALFLLNDVFHLERYGNLPGFAEASPDIVEAVLREAGKFSEEVVAPLNRVGDTEGCTRHDDGSVSTPKGFKNAYTQLTEGGWIGISAPAEFGGQGLPSTLTAIVNEFFCAANMAFAMYTGLTQGAIAALLTHASPELKAKYVPKMVEGIWTGTMNLTEPHCGTDLGLLRTKAVKQSDGSYKISGTKITCPESQVSPGGNIMYNLKHGSSFIAAYTVRIILKYIHRCRVVRIVGSRKISPEDIIMCWIPQLGVVTVRHHPDFDPLPVNMEDRSCKIGYQGSVSLAGNNACLGIRSIDRTDIPDQVRQLIKRQ